MDTIKYQLEAALQQTREGLYDVKDIPQDAENVSGFRRKFQTNPTAMMGVAFGGGMLLATLLGRRKNRNLQRGVSGAVGTVARMATSSRNQKTMDYWNNVKGALVGVAASRLTDYVGNLIPGFREHFKHVKEQVRPIQRAAR